MTATPAKVAQVVADRIDSDGHPVHSAVCPFCRAIAVDADGTAAGCSHLQELDHYASGSYFTFEQEW